MSPPLSRVRHPSGTPASRHCRMSLSALLRFRHTGWFRRRQSAAAAHREDVLSDSRVSNVSPPGAKSRFGPSSIATVDAATSTSVGLCVLTSPLSPAQEQRMKVTVDTRHDSLEEALATVHAAFGSSAQPAPTVVAPEPTTPPTTPRRVGKRAGSRKGAAARPGSKTSPAKGSAAKRAPADRAHVAAPAAETSRRPAPAKKMATGTLKAATARTAPQSKRAGKRSPAKEASSRTGRKSATSVNLASNIAPPGKADEIRAWATTQGMEVKQAGRLPAAVIRAYQERPDLG